MSIQELKDILDRGQLDARDIHSMMRLLAELERVEQLRADAVESEYLLRAELDEARGLANMLTEQRDAARADNARLREALTASREGLETISAGPESDGPITFEWAMRTAHNFLEPLDKALAATDSREELSKVAAESCTCSYATDIDRISHSVGCAAFTNSRSGDERDSEAELKPR